MRTAKLIATAAIALLFVAPALAEDAHHPKDDKTAPKTQPAQPRQGMMGMDRCEPGMGMMCMMGMMRGGDMGAMTGPRAEQRLAALKIELKITDAQAAQWDAYAAAVREAAKAMGAQRAAMTEKMGAATLPQRLDLHEAMLVSHLEHLRKTKTAANALYAVLSDDQKRTADKALMGGMMRGHMGGLQRH